MAVRNPERYFDHRTVKRHIRRGHVSQSDYEAFLEALPDVSDKIRPRDDGGDDDDDYDDAPSAPMPQRSSEPAGTSAFDDDLDDD